MNLSILKLDKKNLNTFIAAGSALIFIGFIDILLNSFFSTNITSFLPDKLSYLTPLLFGLFGLYLIRIELVEINYLIRLIQILIHLILMHY